MSATRASGRLLGARVIAGLVAAAMSAWHVSRGLVIEREGCGADRGWRARGRLIAEPAARGVLIPGVIVVDVDDLADVAVAIERCDQVIFEEAVALCSHTS